MSRVQDFDADGYAQYNWTFHKFRLLARSALDETDMLPKLIGVGDERPNKTLRPGLLDQGRGGVFLRAEVLSMIENIFRAPSTPSRRAKNIGSEVPRSTAVLCTDSLVARPRGTKIRREVVLIRVLNSLGGNKDY